MVRDGTTSNLGGRTGVAHATRHFEVKKHHDLGVVRHGRQLAAQMVKSDGRSVGRTGQNAEVTSNWRRSNSVMTWQPVLSQRVSLDDSPMDVKTSEISKT